MATKITNVIIDDTPSNFSGSVADTKTGLEHYYEEGTTPVHFVNSNVPLEVADVEVFYTKKGRTVTLTFPIINSSFSAPGIFITTVDAIPTRLMPLMTATSGTFEDLGMVFPVIAYSAVTGSIGECRIKRDGTLQFSYGANLLDFPAANSTVGSFSITYNTPSPFNKPYPVP
jgi:hypothetical protein